MRREDASPWGIRTTEPSVWPQYPYNQVPRTPERSRPRYTISNQWDVSLRMRDGVEILLDIYRPQMPGGRFPALCSFSPYTRQLQRDSAPIGQNEAGITEFWVPHGYAHVIVDVRGSNGSGGDWDMWGPVEQLDLAEVIEWVAAQPWCNGRVGMIGCSYFGMTQNLAAEQQPPSLRAIFPYDALTDLYRDALMPGGIPNEGWARFWFSAVTFLNGASSGRNPNFAAMTRHFDRVLSLREPMDGPYWQERSAWPRLDQIQIPSYFGCDWEFYTLHLRGTYDAWERTGPITKRMLLGPAPWPKRQFASYHQEALRWYDMFLKDLDSGVLDADPVQIWIQGEDVWRSEPAWPLPNTRWTDFHLAGDQDHGSLDDSAPAPGARALDYDPAREDWAFGQPSLSYRGPVLERALEVTGPIELRLCMASSATDTDWFATLLDEAPDGSTRELTRGWLRSSHREVDPARSRPNRPWHPHLRSLPLEAEREEELAIELMATSNLFLPGHRIRLDLSNCDSVNRHIASGYRRAVRLPAHNTVVHGPGKSRLNLPVIPR
ncbi:MAG TPA: CocE/NonD family hydrolase [Candidatus Nitrosotalea sp.]|nr:CocE/NonD family hydrolase [Candidatus Nitrosotalea sp.]